jgi:hypothetical protein
MHVRFGVLPSCLEITYVEFSYFKRAQEKYGGTQVPPPSLNQNETCTSRIAKASTFRRGCTLISATFYSDIQARGERKHFAINSQAAEVSRRMNNIKSELKHKEL